MEQVVRDLALQEQALHCEYIPDWQVQLEFVLQRLRSHVDLDPFLCDFGLHEGLVQPLDEDEHSFVGNVFLVISHLDEFSKQKTESMTNPVRFQLFKVEFSLLSDLHVGC